MDDGELELLLSLDGSDFEMAPGVVVEFTARRTETTLERPHGISYAFNIGANASLTITGAGQKRIKAVPTTLRRPSVYSMISGER